MNTDIFFDGFTGVPATHLLRMAQGKRTKAHEERCQDLHFKIVNTKVARRIQALIKRQSGLYEIHQAEQDVERQRLFDLIQSGKFTANDNPCLKRIKLDPETGEDLPQEPEVRRPYRVPNILRNSHSKRMALAKKKKQQEEAAQAAAAAVQEMAQTN